nr:hypothetical protein [Pseudomonas mendocina]
MLTQRIVFCGAHILRRQLFHQAADDAKYLQLLVVCGLLDHFQEAIAYQLPDFGTQQALVDIQRAFLGKRLLKAFGDRYAILEELRRDSTGARIITPAIVVNHLGQNGDHIALQIHPGHKVQVFASRPLRKAHGVFLNAFTTDQAIAGTDVLYQRRHLFDGGAFDQSIELTLMDRNSNPFAPLTKRLLNAADHVAAILLGNCHHLLVGIDRDSVVGVQKRNILAFGMGQCQIPCCALPLTLLTQQFDLRISRAILLNQFVAAIRRTIVDDDDFDFFQRLR